MSRGPVVTIATVLLLAGLAEPASADRIDGTPGDDRLFGLGGRGGR